MTILPFHKLVTHKKTTRQFFRNICEKDTKTLSVLIVYRMGRLCGGGHEISSIKAPLFLCGWVGGGWVGGGVVYGCL